MLSENSIEVYEISKRYEIYEKPVDRLKQLFSNFAFKFLGFERQLFFKEFNALERINFKVKKGETLGIIGLNGSGKSTLLQIICGTAIQSHGRVETSGRVAALLELGAGFNPEFTGRENVYMCAALYGLTKKDIDEKIEDIFSFADIGEFVEHPVKTYSSGMFVRLAFSVIAHVNADILVIDEALAVGDAIFTQKCMRFLRNFKKNGGTLTFVSHDTSAVLNLCERAVWLDRGEMKAIGDSKSVVEKYLQFTLQEQYGYGIELESTNADGLVEGESNLQLDPGLDLEIDYGSLVVSQDNLANARGWKTGAGEILSVELKHNSVSADILKGGEIVAMAIKASVFKDFHNPIIGFLVRDRLGQDLFGENTLPLTNTSPRSFSKGEVFITTFTFRLPMLPNGQYTVMASLAEGTLENNIQHHWLHDSLVLTVSSSEIRWGLVGVEFKSIEMVGEHK